MLNSLGSTDAENTGSHGIAHLARTRVVPARHGRRQAHLHRSVPERTRRAPTASGSPSASTRSAVTHGHGDHSATPSVSQQEFGSPVFAMVELAGWLEANGLPADQAVGFNKGGTIEVAGIKVHDDQRLPFQLGPRRHVHRRAGGIRLPSRGRQARLLRRRHLRVRRHAADRTGSTSPTSPCSRSATTTRWAPTEAALALELLGNPRCVPCHWGTFPPLVGRPAQLAELTSAQVEQIAPGDTVSI